MVFITHKLNEAYMFGDQVSVLRRGRVVGEITPEQFRAIPFEEARKRIVHMLFGSDSFDEDTVDEAMETARLQRKAGPDIDASPVLEVDGVSAVGEWGEASLRGISFAVRQREIFGIAGVDGNGQKQLAEVLAGQRRVAAGRIRLEQTDITHLVVGKRLKLGLSYITDDRYGEGTLPSFSVATNVVAKRIGERPFWKWYMEQQAEINGFATSIIRLFDVRTPSEQSLMGTLSGGNIQKVVLGRELVTEPRIIVYNKPTYGLDLANVNSVRKHIRNQADAGVAAIVISTDIDELMELCDRIGVMSRGQLVGIVENKKGAEIKIGELMVVV